MLGTVRDAALAIADRGTAAWALARSAELINRGPGLMSDVPPPDVVAELIAEAEPLATGDPAAETALLVARAFAGVDDDPETLAWGAQAADQARAVGDPVLISMALDALTGSHLALGDVAAAREDVDERLERLSRVRPMARNGLEISDAYGMATVVLFAEGDFAGARARADIQARLPFHCEDGHLATARGLKVDAMAGEIERVLVDAELFRRGWVRAGRPVARALAGGAYAVAMVHGLRGDAAARSEWVEIAAQLGAVMDRAADSDQAWAPTFDAILALHQGDLGAALSLVASRPADFRTCGGGEWRPWYAALWAESAVLARAPGAAEGLVEARPIVARNPSAAAMVERAAALAEGDSERLVDLAATLADQGCRYQAARTLVLAGGSHAAEGRAAMAALGAAPMAEPAG
jgi:hypothetical protein